MATQTGSFDLKALREAAKKAINYVTDMANGIFVHPEGDSHNGVKIQDAIEIIRNDDTVASFGDEAVIGTDETGKIVTTLSGISGYGPDNISYFSVDNSGSSVSIRKKTDSHTVDLTTSSNYSFEVPELDDLTSGASIGVTVKSNWLTGGASFTKGTAETKTSTPAFGTRYSIYYDGNHTFSQIHTVSGSVTCTIYAEYVVTAPAPTYLFGQLYGDPGDPPGPFSLQEGISVAAGDYAHAEGYQTQASGNYSHAQNEGTIAADYAQTALGQWNVANSSTYYAVIVGNGSADNDRSDAFAMTWEGDLRLALDTSGSGSTEFDNDLYNEISGLGWQSEVII